MSQLNIEKLLEERTIIRKTEDKEEILKKMEEELRQNPNDKQLKAMVRARKFLNQ